MSPLRRAIPAVVLGLVGGALLWSYMRSLRPASTWTTLGFSARQIGGRWVEEDTVDGEIVQTIPKASRSAAQQSCLAHSRAVLAAYQKDAPSSVVVGYGRGEPDGSYFEDIIVPHHPAHR